MLALVCGRRFGELDRTRPGSLACREAGGDALAAALGRRHHRDEHAAQAPLPHQGRAARGPRPCRARRHRRDLGRAGRRSGGASAPVRPCPIPPRWRTPARSCERYRLDVPDSVTRALADPANESPKPGDPVFAATSYAFAAKPSEVFQAVETAARAAGYEPILLGTALEGEAREVAATHARLARELRATGRRAVILSGGELTVTLRGQGRGGPNQEYALALAVALAGTGGVAALAGDTDGTDGGGASRGPGGAFIDETTLARARQIGLDPAVFLADNNSTEFFEKLGDLLAPGPTYTNVNDFRAILVDSP